MATSSQLDNHLGMQSQVVRGDLVVTFDLVSYINHYVAVLIHVDKAKKKKKKQQWHAEVWEPIAESVKM